MGEGLKRALLHALCSRGPWSSTDLLGRPPEPWTLTGVELHALYEAICHGQEEPQRVIGCALRSDRKSDRAFQLLRSVGLIEFAGSPKQWRVVGYPEVPHGS